MTKIVHVMTPGREGSPSKQRGFYLCFFWPSRLCASSFFHRSPTNPAHSRLCAARWQVLFQRRRHGKFTPVECGVAHSVEPRLAGQDLQQHVVAAWAGDDDAHVGNLKGWQAWRGAGWRRLTPSRSSGQSGLGECCGSGKSQESPAVRRLSFGCHRASCAVIKDND